MTSALDEITDYTLSESKYHTSNCKSLSDLSDISDIKNIISISDSLRLHSGNVKVRGTIIGFSKLYKMIKAAIFVCNKCELEDYIEYQIPEDQPKSINRKCSNCNVVMKADSYEYVNAVKVEIQDSDKFSDIEKLSGILFDEYTLDIQVGSKVIVTGSIQIIKQKNGKSIPRIYSSFIEYENKQKFVLLIEILMLYIDLRKSKKVR